MGCCGTKKQPVEHSHPPVRQPPSQQSPPPSFESRYTTLETLTRSAFTRHLKATFNSTGQLRFVKVVRKAGLTDPARLTEVNILRNLDHPNVLRLLEVLDDPVNFYLCSEYVEGSPLLSFVSSRNLMSEATIAEIMYQVLSAVAYCHSKRVVHRDIRPEHIYVHQERDRWDLKVSDFGSAGILDPRHKLTGVLGSTLFLAPEVVKGNYDEKCDLWSCGILMYLLLTGTFPYAGESEKEVLKEMMSGRAEVKIAGVSNEAAVMLASLLTKDPKTRLSAPEALQHYWILSRVNHTTDLSPVLHNLQQFSARSQFRDALLTYLTTRVTSNSDIEALNSAFRQFDKNSDGIISLTELQTASSQILTESEVQSVLSQLDSNQDHRISYTEFLRAAQDHRKLLSRRNLEQAFRSMDVDQDGVLSVSELKEAMPGLWSDAQWSELLKEADTDGDGVINMKEFTTLLLRQDL